MKGVDEAVDCGDPEMTHDDAKHRYATCDVHVSSSLLLFRLN